MGPFAVCRFENIRQAQSQICPSPLLCITLTLKSGKRSSCLQKGFRLSSVTYARKKCLVTLLTYTTCSLVLEQWSCRCVQKTNTHTNTNKSPQTALYSLCCLCSANTAPTACSHTYCTNRKLLSKRRIFMASATKPT